MFTYSFQSTQSNSTPNITSFMISFSWTLNFFPCPTSSLVILVLRSMYCLWFLLQIFLGKHRDPSPVSENVYFSGQGLLFSFICISVYFPHLGRCPFSRSFFLFLSCPQSVDFQRQLQSPEILHNLVTTFLLIITQRAIKFFLFVSIGISSLVC